MLSTPDGLVVILQEMYAPGELALIAIEREKVPGLVAGLREAAGLGSPDDPRPGLDELRAMARDLVLLGPLVARERGDEELVIEAMRGVLQWAAGASHLPTGEWLAEPQPGERAPAPPPAPPETPPTVDPPQGEGLRLQRPRRPASPHAIHAGRDTRLVKRPDGEIVIDQEHPSDPAQRPAIHVQPESAPMLIHCMLEEAGQEPSLEDRRPGPHALRTAARDLTRLGPELARAGCPADRLINAMRTALLWAADASALPPDAWLLRQ